MARKKAGQNKIWCKKYLNEERRLKNKARRLVRHLLRFPADRVALTAIKGTGHIPKHRVAYVNAL